MKSIFFAKIKESFISVLPMALTVVLFGLTITPLESGVIVQFLLACVFVFIGMSFFNIGAESSMIPIGQNMGSYISRKNKIWLLVLCSFLLGILVTVAEPDLNVLASYVPVDNTLFVLCVSVGVGLFLTIGVLRIMFKIHLNIILGITYFLIFIMVIFLSSAIIPVSFDSGSVTTGPISVPFIMAFGLGLASVRGQGSKEDSFGLIALSSAGPILTVMLFLYLSGVTGADASVPNAVHDTSGFGPIVLSFLSELPDIFLEVGIILFPIALFFLVFQWLAFKLPKQQVVKILIGLLWTFFGISFFLTGVSVGFLPVGTAIGAVLGQSPWLLVLVCGILGFVMIAVEPAVGVLNKQIEQITNGSIKRRTMFLCIASGVAVAMMLCSLRVITGISILWILIPAYVLVLGLGFFNSQLFTGIAFDSGGVSTGAMATTFAFPMIMGACQTLGGTIMTDAFGCLALIAVAPILTIQILGFIYKLGMIKHEKKLAQEDVSKRVEIIEYD